MASQTCIVNILPNAQGRMAAVMANVEDPPLGQDRTEAADALRRKGF